MNRRSKPHNCKLAPKLTNYLVANGLEYTVACDIVQETFIRLWKKSGELSATDSISGFVFAVARNLRTDYYRRSRFMIYQDEIADEGAGMTDPAAKNTSAVYLRKRLQDAIAQLPEDMRTAYTLFQIAKRSVREIAELTGTSGSGKTTVAKLANGTLLPWSGEILLNGKPMNEYTRSEYYATVGAVDQSIMLFSGTVGQNLTLFAPSYEARELQQAVRDAAIEQELTALDLNVAEGGSNFSGGQRQRLEIARVLTHRTPLLILDEATSALDLVTEVEIDKAIRRRGCACIVVAHRLSTIRDCDEIIMLDHGIVAERGTHEALMAAGGKYAAMMKLEQGG